MNKTTKKQDLASPTVDRSWTGYIKRAVETIVVARQPRYLIYHPTDRCNASCAFCIGKLGETKKKGGERPLTMRQWEQFARSYGRLTKFAVSGGEPSLVEDIAERIIVFCIYTRPLIVEFATNASNPERIRVIAEKLLRSADCLRIEFHISIDGYADCHDRLRGIQGLFEKVQRTVGLLSELRKQDERLVLKANVLYLPDNKNILPRLLRELREQWGFDRVHCTYPCSAAAPDRGEIVGSTVDQKRPGGFRDTSEEFRHFYTIVRDFHRNPHDAVKEGLHGYLFGVMKSIKDEMLCSIRVEENMGKYCKAGRSVLVVDRSGHVYPCEPLWRSIGTLHDHRYRIGPILKSPAMKHFTRTFLSEDGCHCLWGCSLLGALVITPSMYPKILATMMDRSVRRLIAK